jgi:hypothetical protein
LKLFWYERRRLGCFICLLTVGCADFVETFHSLLHRPLRSLPFSSALSLFFVLATIFERNVPRRGSGKGETPKSHRKRTPPIVALEVTKRRPNRTGLEYRPRVGRPFFRQYEKGDMKQCSHGSYSCSQLGAPNLHCRNHSRCLQKSLYWKNSCAKM